MAGTATDADFSDDGEDDVFGCHALRPLAVNKNVQRLGFALHQTLGRQDMFHFAGADAEGQRAECAVGGCVTIAADNRLAGLGNAQFRTDDVDDSLVLAVHVEQADSGFAAVLFQRLELQLRVVVKNRQRAIGRGYRVIHYGEGEIRAANLAALHLQSCGRLAGKCLRG